MEFEKYKGMMWASGRISIGFVFLWAFFDKLLGLGFATCTDRATGDYLGFMCDKSFIEGGKVTAGFLGGATGPFAPVFHAIAGNLVVEWLFMIGLLAIGIGLMLGVAMRLSTYSASIMLFLMWLAVLPKDVNPFMDDHIVYIFFLMLMNWYNAGEWLGLGKWWSQLSVVKKSKILQ